PVPRDEFVSLIAVGKDRGTLTPDDLMPVIKTVDLTRELIDDIVDHLRAEGITYEDPDEIVAEEPIVDDATGVVPVIETAAGKRRAKRRLSMLLGRLPEEARTGGGGCDPVRMY